MGQLGDALAMLDIIDRIEGVISSFLFADWAGAVRRSGPLGIVAEAGRTIAGSNRSVIHIPRESEWSGGEIERFLRHYGVRVWDRGFTASTIYFSVKERQANWAEYLLLRRGIPVASTLVNPENSRYAERHAPGDQPPAWADRKSRPRGLIDRLDDWL